MISKHIYKDDGVGGFVGEYEDHGADHSAQINGEDPFLATIVYTAGNGSINFFPDFISSFPIVEYGFRDVGDNYTTESGAVYVKQERYVTGVNYEDAYDFFIDGSITVKYHQESGATSANYTSTMDKIYSFDLGYISTMVPNSGVFLVDGEPVFDRQGRLYTDIDPVTGEATQVGTIDYSKKELTITSDNAHFVSNTENVFLYCSSAMTSDVKDSMTTVVFRTPGSPITPSSFTVEAVASDGTVLSGTGDFEGKIVGTGMSGTIRYLTGIVNLSFGTMVDDDVAAQAEDWYHVDNVVDDEVWKPYFVDASTITMNCVIESYLPLDADLLGLDPVRLPMDGKVPIFRDGEIVLIHNTLSTTVPANPAVAGATYEVGRTNVSLIELYDQNEVYIPDTNYTVDLALGTVTMANPLDLTQAGDPPYEPVEPLIMMHRIEDMSLVSDVQITGHMSLISPLTHTYPADTSYVSSVLPIGDLQARAYNEFEQTSWTSVWSDTLVGNQPVASFDLINFPILVENDSATQERFACIFQSTTLIQVVGEHLGVLKDGSSTTWNITEKDIAPLNPITGNPYFTITMAGWGAGWATGNVFRFNTAAANYPLWFVRTTLQGPATESSDNYACQIRGDSS